MQESEKPNDHDIELPEEILGKFDLLGDQLIEISEKEVSFQDMVKVLTSIMLLSVAVGALIKSKQYHKLVEYYDANLVARITNPGESEKSVEGMIKYQKVIITSVLLLLTIMSNHFGFDKLPKIKLFNSDKSIPLSTHVLPALGKILKNISK